MFKWRRTEKAKETEETRTKEQKFAAAAAAAADVILEAMIDGVVVADMNGTVIQCNTSYAMMFGFESGSKVVGSTITERITEREIPRVMAEFEKSFKTGGTINLEFIGKDKIGKEFPIMLNSTVLKDEKGNIVGNVGVLRDITERKKQEEMLRAANDEAQKEKEVAENKTEQLKRFNKVAVDRELKMKELKERIKELEGKLRDKT